jgi:cell division protein ZapA
MRPRQQGTVTVKIYDREYALRTSGEAERLHLLCNTLDRRMREVAREAGTVDTMKVAILAAVSLTDELLRAQDALKQMDDTVSRRSLECVTMLDQFLG